MSSQPQQHGRVRTPFFPGTGGVPPLFREREPPSVPTSAKRGFAKNFRVPGKKGEQPESGFGSGNDQTPYAPEMPVPPSGSHFRSWFRSVLSVPGSVPPRRKNSQQALPRPLSSAETQTRSLDTALSSKRQLRPQAGHRIRRTPWREDRVTFRFTDRCDVVACAVPWLGTARCDGGFLLPCCSRIAAGLSI